MVAYNFKKAFVPKVESGEKTQTIRGTRKRHARPGERMQTYTGMRSKECRKLISDPLCKSVTPITIESCQGWHRVRVNGLHLTDRQIKALAIADGFETVEEFIEFFKSNHGLPFEGVLIKWETDK